MSGVGSSGASTNVRSTRSLSCSSGRVRGAPLSLEFQLPRRCLLPRRARCGGLPARARRPRADRPRRPLRSRALRRGGKRGGSSHRLRRRAHPCRPQPGLRCHPGRPRPSAHRDTGPSRLTSGRDRPRSGGLLAPVPCHQRGPSRRGREGRPRHDLDRVGELAGGHFLVLTGCRKERCRPRSSKPAPRRRAESSTASSRRFGRDNVVVELLDHDDPLDSARNDALADSRRRRRASASSPRTSSTTPPRRRTASRTVLAAVRSGAPSTSSTAGCRRAGWRHLRSGAEQARRFARYPGAVELAGELGRAVPSTCASSPPGSPTSPSPPVDEMSLPRAASSKSGAPAATARGTPSGCPAPGASSTTSSR